MWWYSTGWWWWWFVFLIIFFLLPLGYGWGYRGWGPWYRGRSTGRYNEGSTGPVDSDLDEGWGWISSFLWVILLIALIWLVAATLWRPV
jgi:hypothetical protein